jgi:hypothetical protein
MATDFSNAPTEPDPLAPPQPGAPIIPPMGSTVPWPPHPQPPAPYNAPGPFGPPAPPGQQPPPAPPVPYNWASYSGSAPTVVDPPRPMPHWGGGQSGGTATYNPPPPRPLTAPAPRPAPLPAPRPRPRTRPVSAPPPRASTRSIPVERVWRLLPVPHILLGVGMVLMLTALNIPWGQTADGTLVYAQSFPVPFLSDQPEIAGQFAQNLVWSAGMLSLCLAGLNYFLTIVNWMLRPLRAMGCATVLLMPLMLILMGLLAVIEIGALLFGAFDPLAGLPLLPWQPGFTLAGAHAELGYYAWYTGVVLNGAGMMTQPFVKR